MIRIAMIGAGSMANQVHYPSLASFDDVEIAAVCDLDAARLQATADKYQVEKRYLDYRRMVDDVQPDGVYVIGQPHIMYDIWCWCLRQGLNLYIEKPMGITLHQARALAHLAEENGCITQVSFQRRSTPMVVQLREACLAARSHRPCGLPLLQKRDLPLSGSARPHAGRRRACHRHAALDLRRGSG